MKGKDLINYIQENGLEDAVVAVTATMYYNGDHDCRTTTDVDIMQSSVYDDDAKGYVNAIDFYVDSNLY